MLKHVRIASKEANLHWWWVRARSKVQNHVIVDQQTGVIYLIVSVRQIPTSAVSTNWRGEIPNVLEPRSKLLLLIYDPVWYLFCLFTLFKQKNRLKQPASMCLFHPENVKWAQLFFSVSFTRSQPVYGHKNPDNWTSRKNQSNWTRAHQSRPVMFCSDQN